jgi:hypothetical protein
VLFRTKNIFKAISVQPCSEKQIILCIKDKKKLIEPNSPVDLQFNVKASEAGAKKLNDLKKGTT